MKAMIGFFGTLLALPKPWVAWVMLLMTANMVVPLFYLRTPEARVVLGAAVFGAILQTAIFSAKGFVRLLGIGHIAWVPMVLWLWTRLDAAPAGSLFRYWLLATIVLVSLSLLIDATDVIRYRRGEREPQLGGAFHDS
ncbi:MAG: hypothetical protein GY769_20875 [bacterium]|nr:hypothetical protein [bacterium]